MTTKQETKKAQTKQETQEAVQELKQDLLTLRDEIRVQIHLGTMELKERWPKLEAKLEQQANQLKDSSLKVMHELRNDFRELRDVLLQSNKPE